MVAPLMFGAEGALGGGERYPFELSRALSHHVDTTFVSFGAIRASRIQDRLRVEVFRRLGALAGNTANPASIAFFRPLGRADVIHSHAHGTLVGDLSVLVARFLRTPVFITDHGGGSWLNMSRLVRLSRWSDGLLAVSRFSSDTFPCPPTRRDIIYGGVDADYFAPGSEERTSDILFVGRILPHKGLRELIEAFPADVKDCRLVILGRAVDPAFLADLRKAARDKPVSFRTAPTDKDVRQAYRRASCLVLPSTYGSAVTQTTSQPELLGLVLLEAMACSTPVVCTDVGGMPEVVVDGETGFVVPAAQPSSIVDACIRLATSTRLRRRMGCAARDHVIGRYTWDHVALRCLEAYGKGGASRGSTSVSRTRYQNSESSR